MAFEWHVDKETGGITVMLGDKYLKMAPNRTDLQIAHGLEKLTNFFTHSQDKFHDLTMDMTRDEG